MHVHLCVTLELDVLERLIRNQKRKRKKSCHFAPKWDHGFRGMISVPKISMPKGFLAVELYHFLFYVLNYMTEKSIGTESHEFLTTSLENLSPIGMLKLTQKVGPLPNCIVDTSNSVPKI